MEQKTKKVLAVGAVAAVVGVGGLATLAAWNDSEWVFAGNGAGGAGLGTSTFNVQQNRGTAPDLTDGAWEDHESNPGGEIVFTLGALNLTPGDSVYAPVALQTTEDSIAGDLTLQNPVAATGIDPGEDLWDALTYSVRVTDTEPATACSADSWDTFGAVLVDAEAFDTEIDPGAQAVEAASGNTQYYCFQVTLPAVEGVDALQGQTAAPAWEFSAVSVEAEAAEGGA